MNLLRNLSLPKILKLDPFTRKKVSLCGRGPDTFQHCRTLITGKEGTNTRCASITHCRYSTEVTRNSESLVWENDEEVTEEEHNTGKIFEEVAAGDPMVLKALKLLEFELRVLREGECKVPNALTVSQWRQLLNIQSPALRRKYLSFLRLNEIKDEVAKQKGLVRREIILKQKEDLGFHYYGLSGHSMFMRIYDKDLNRLLDQRLQRAELNVVFDCSYTEYMGSMNLKACVKQIIFSINAVRLGRYPCNITFCNVNWEDQLGKMLKQCHPGIQENSVFESHSQSYLDLFPREKLIYLTPHVPNELVTFSHDDVYIIGAFVDKGRSVKASLAKAKKDNIKMAKFPIDRFLFWKQGTKSLPLNIVINILIEMGFYNDWKKAFRSIPRRCLLE